MFGKDLNPEYKFLIFTFRGPCIVIYSYNKTQRDALFLKFILIKNSKYQFLIFTFKGPCIVIYSYNKNQRDALFLKFILIKNSKYFGQIYCPSSGVSTLYKQQQAFVMLVMLTVY
jgi:hypothetical protein